MDKGPCCLWIYCVQKEKMVPGPVWRPQTPPARSWPPAPSRSWAGSEPPPSPTLRFCFWTWWRWGWARVRQHSKRARCLLKFVLQVNGVIVFTVIVLPASVPTNDENQRQQHEDQKLLSQTHTLNRRSWVLPLQQIRSQWPVSTLKKKQLFLHKLSGQINTVIPSSKI